MSGKNQVPRFDGSDYTRWKKMVVIWRDVTNIEKAKMGPTLILNMKGKALDIALELDNNDIDNLLNKFEEVYGSSDELLIRFEEYDSMKRAPNQPMREYIHLFEQKISTLKSLKLEIPELMQSHKLLKGAGLSKTDEKLAFQTCEDIKEFKKAKETLFKLSDHTNRNQFSDNNKSQSSDDGIVTVKQEKSDPEDITFYTKKLQIQDENNHDTWFNSNPNHNRFQRPNLKADFNQARSSNHRLCYGCGAPNHWIRDCPYVQNMFHRENEAQVHQVGGKRKRFQAPFTPKNTYFNTEEEKENQTPENYSDEESSDKYVFYQSNVGSESEEVFLVGETLNKAVLDCGASKTLCGIEWYKSFIDSRSPAQLKEVKEFPSETIFKFGVGKMKAEKQAIIPVTVCDRDILLNVQVVATDIPLLLSLDTMKRMELNIDFYNDKVEMNGKQYNVETTSSGHYCLPLEGQRNDEVVNFVDVFVAMEDNPKRAALKLHRRFAHAHSNKILKLLKNAGITNNQVETELLSLDRSCEFCLKHKRSHARPKVSLPLADTFNELVCLDLKHISGKLVLHCIDYVTRFSAAHVVRNKQPSEFIEKFFKVWISIFGPPEKILSDNGGEFINEESKALCSAFNIIHLDTAAESPFSNGIVERHNALLGHMTEKVHQDIGCSLDVALMWAVHAKNSLINVFGFSPYQLVFGKNPSVPGNSTNKLPALNSTTSSQIVADHLNSLHKARKSYVEAESSDRIRRALKGHISEGTHQKFCVGDIVYYKRQASKTWLGPAKVLAQDGAQVLLKTGARSLIKVHPCKLLLKEEAEKQLNQRTDISNTPETTPSLNNYESQIDSSDSDESDLNETPTTTHSNENSENITDNTTGPDMPLLEDELMLNTHVNNPALNSASTSKIGSSSNKVKTPLKLGDKIAFREQESNEWKVAILKSRGGKATGQYKNYWNVKLHNGKETGINLENVEWLRHESNDQSVSDSQAVNMFASNINNEIFAVSLFTDSKSEDYADAKQKEFDNWKKFNVFQEVKRADYPQQAVLSSRWVTSKKNIDNEIAHKARLVVKGFQEVDLPSGDSPTAGKNMLRLFIALAGIIQASLKTIDVRTAFLQSDCIDRILLLKPPKEFRTDDATVWKLNKPVYGLVDAAKCWFLTVKRKLIEFGCTPLSLDNSVYVYISESQLCGFAVIHVDDFLLGGNNKFKTHVIDKLYSSFQIGSCKESKFKYIGWNFDQKENGTIIDQNDYQEKILEIKLAPQRENQRQCNLSEHEKKQYQELLGQLQWISSQTRPDIRFNVLECSTRSNSPQVDDVLKLNRVVKKLKKRTTQLFFPTLTHDISKLKLYVFSDASLCNLPDKVFSTHAHVIFLVSDQDASPLSWCSKKIKRVVNDILSAECMALGHAIDEAMMLRNSILEALCVTHKDYVPIICYIDSKSLCENIHSSNNAADLKLRRQVASIRQHLELKEINEVVWIPTKQQLADCLTKSTASPDSLLSVLETGKINNGIVSL